MPFAEFVEQRSDRLLSLAWLITRDIEDAKDAVQDALTGLYQRWEKLPDGDEFEAYVHRSVVNACLKVIRGRRAAPVADIDLLNDRASCADPAQAVADSDEAWRLCGILSPVQRSAVVLRFYADLSFAEIAGVLDCREATARSHVHRAMRQLRARLEEGKQ